MIQQRSLINSLLPIIGDSKSYLSGLPRATHKCASLFWRIFSLAPFLGVQIGHNMHKCPGINVLSVSMCLNVKTECDVVKAKTEPTENFGKLNQQKICLSRYVLLSAGRSGLAIRPKFGSPFFHGNGISALAIMKILKNSCHFVKWKPLPKFGSPVFRVFTETEYQHQPL